MSFNRVSSAEIGFLTIVLDCLKKTIGNNPKNLKQDYQGTELLQLFTRFSGKAIGNLNLGPKKLKPFQCSIKI